MKSVCSTCTRDALFFCDCSNPPQLSCEIHRHTTHDSKSIYFSLDKCSSSKLIKECYKEMKSIEKIKKRALKTVTKLIKRLKASYENYEKVLNNIKKTYIDVITTVGVNPRISLVNYSKVDEIMTNILSNRKLEKISKLSSSSLIETLKTPKPAKNFILSSSTISARSSIRNHLPDIISVPIARSNLIKCIDINTLNVHQVLLSGPEFPYEYGFAMLPFGQMLIYGGVIQVKNLEPIVYLMSDETYLINPQEKSIISVGKAKCKADMSNGAVFNNEVYVFGGYDEKNSQLNSCEKFSLATQVWTDISKLPTKMGYTTSVAINEGIFVANRHSKQVLAYNPADNRYYDSLNVGTEYKVLLGNGEMAFLIEGDKIYLYSDGWNFINVGLRESLDSILIAPYMLKDSKIYFLTGKFNFQIGVITKSNLYQLNLETFEINLLAKDILKN